MPKFVRLGEGDSQIYVNADRVDRLEARGGEKTQTSIHFGSDAVGTRGDLPIAEVVKKLKMFDSDG